MADNSSRIPASVMRLPGFAVGGSNREVIIDYLVAQEGSVMLTDLQKDLLGRWNHADDLMRSFRYSRREIANLLVKKYGYGIATAYRDLEDAQYVFGNSRKSNKRYVLALHVERIEAAISLAERQGRKELLPKLYDCLTNAAKLLPEDNEKKLPPAAIVFEFTQNIFQHISPDAGITEDEAIQIAAERLTKMGVAVEDIVHDDIHDE